MSLPNPTRSRVVLSGRGWFVAAFVGLGVAFAVRVAVRSYAAAQMNFHGFPPAEISRHPEATKIPGLSPVTFRTRAGYLLSGWYVPSRNRAAVVLLHGTHTDRSAVLDEERILSAAGFGVLSFDWPSYGQSQPEGPITWGAHERTALGTAIDWLSQRPDVDSTRIGAFGLSMGGYILAQVAARDTRLRAVVLAAVPTDIFAQTDSEYSKWWLLSEKPAEQAIRDAGMMTDSLIPGRIVGDIAPRPVLVLGGDHDHVVPEAMVREMFSAAHEPKALWIVPGAAHGNYARVSPSLYAKRLTDFFHQHLVAPASPMGGAATVAPSVAQATHS